MKLYPGFKEEYKKRHDAIWPELVREIKDHGIVNYVIFLDDETNALFIYQEETENSVFHEYGTSEIVRKWWRYMADIMDTNPDNSPVAVRLEEMFALN